MWGLLSYEQCYNHTIPHIQDFSSFLHMATMFSEIDVIRANHQIPVMPEGIQNSCNHSFWFIRMITYHFVWRMQLRPFWRFMGEILSGIHFCYMYIYNLLILSTTAREHLSHLWKVLEHLSEHGILINPTKSMFGVPWFPGTPCRQQWNLTIVWLSPSNSRFSSVYHTTETLWIPWPCEFLKLITATMCKYLAASTCITHIL